jgi:hypothetical protein
MVSYHNSVGTHNRILSNPFSCTSAQLTKIHRACSSTSCPICIALPAITFVPEADELMIEGAVDDSDNVGEDDADVDDAVDDHDKNGELVIGAAEAADDKFKESDTEREGILSRSQMFKTIDG